MGGTRYLGAELLTELEKNVEFRVCTVSNRQVQGRTNHILCNRRDKSGLSKIIKEYRPTTIIDFLGYDANDIEMLSDVILDSFHNEHIHYIYVSTFFVYKLYELSEYYSKPLKVMDSAISEIDIYTRNKILSEISLSNYFDINRTTILRLPFIFSYDDYTGRFENLCEMARCDLESSPPLGGGRYSMLEKSEGARIISDLVKRGITGVLNLSNKGSTTTEEALRIIQSVAPKKCVRERGVPFRDPYEVNQDLCTYLGAYNIGSDLKSALIREAVSYYKRVELASF